VVRWVDAAGMPYDDDHNESLTVTIPAREVRMREVEEARLEYLEEFWQIKTNEMKILDLRELNEEIVTRTGYPAPEEYSI
jgi:hypothetical protein